MLDRTGRVRVKQLTLNGRKYRFGELVPTEDREQLAKLGSMGNRLSCFTVDTRDGKLSISSGKRQVPPKAAEKTGPS